MTDLLGSKNKIKTIFFHIKNLQHNNLNTLLDYVKVEQ